MKTLYMVRHAKSSWKDENLEDIDRPLNKRGKRDAPFMGKLLQEKGILPDVLMTSPALRAHTTAHLFADQMDYPTDKLIVNNAIYEADVSDLLQVIQNDLKNEWDSAMIFGHNMTYTTFANLYADSYIDNVPTCAIVAIAFDVKSWSKVTRENGRVLFFEYPKKSLF